MTLPFFYWSDNNYNNLSNTPIWGREELTNLMINGRLILTINCGNPLLVPSDYLDTKCNIILDVMNNGSNKVLVNHPDMLKHIEQKYPEYRFVAGTLYHLYDKEKQYIDKIHTIRATPHMLETNPWYSNIPKNKIELCGFSTCANCTQYEQCMMKDSTNRLMFSYNNIIANCSTLKFEPCTSEKIAEYIKQGYHNFYFDMRAIKPADFDFFVKFYITLFIKPEYHMNAQLILEGSQSING